MPETRAPRALDAAGHSVAPPKVSLAFVLRQPRLVIVFGLFFFTFLYMANLQVALAFLTNARFGWTEEQVGSVFLGMGVVMLVVQGLLIGPIAKRFRDVSVVLFGAVISAVGLVMIALAYTVPLLVVGLLALGLGLGVTQPLLASIAAQHAGTESRGALLGYSQSSGGLARTIGPTLAGFLYNDISPGAPFLGGAISAGVVFVLAVALGRGAPTPES